MTMAGSAAAVRSSYTIIAIRGTGKAWEPSAGFRTMNSNAMCQLPGGKEYDTVYPADYSPNSASGTQDIINKITLTLQFSPGECFTLEGYSQGAAAIVDAMSCMTGPASDAVKGVFLIGYPHTRRANGQSGERPSPPCSR